MRSADLDVRVLHFVEGIHRSPANAYSCSMQSCGLLRKELIGTLGLTAAGRAHGSSVTRTVGALPGSAAQRIPWDGEDEWKRPGTTHTIQASYAQGDPHSFNSATPGSKASARLI
jgi:hypothetical protein